MIWQRIKNLWLISDLEWLTEDKKLKMGLPVTVPEKPVMRMAQIVKRKTKEDIIKEVLKQE